MSVHRGRGVCLSACWDNHPLDQATPGSRHPPEVNPPGPGTPRSRTPGPDPPQADPPDQAPPWEADFSIWLTSSWYTSYWNAFLFNIIFTHSGATGRNTLQRGYPIQPMGIFFCSAWNRGFLRLSLSQPLPQPPQPQPQCFFPNYQLTKENLSPKTDNICIDCLYQQLQSMKGAKKCFQLR